MPWPARLASLFRSARRPSSNYWMTVPIHRLTYLLLAIFCMFGMVGCFVDLLALGEHPLPFVMVWTSSAVLSLRQAYSLAFALRPVYGLLP